MMSHTESEEIPLSPMSRKQRRVLGVLLEKAFTTPDQYPLTLKATLSGCNQKNNRDPVSNYDEDDVRQTLEQLQERGYVGVLHTESGRTERYRHYLRHRTKLNERQLAIITELLLRGKQQPGELRTRASRMVPIDTQEDLRRELQALLDDGLVRSNGALDRRGIEVDHNLYPEGENVTPLSAYREEPAGPATGFGGSSTGSQVSASTFKTASGSGSAHDVSERAEAPLSAGRSSPARDSLADDVEQLKDQVRSLQERVSALVDEVDDLRRQLGA
jgi:uncharacterized protein